MPSVDAHGKLLEVTNKKTRQKKQKKKTQQRNKVAAVSQDKSDTHGGRCGRTFDSGRHDSGSVLRSYGLTLQIAHLKGEIRREQMGMEMDK